MTLDPIYDPQADETLKVLESSVDPQELHIYGAICDAIDLVCDHGDSAEARRQQLRTPSGNAAWRVQVRGTSWVLLWWPFDTEARIFYIGPG